MFKNPDYPAAHSMDSGWFATDETGTLAFFETGEAGAIPKNATYYTGEYGGFGEDVYLKEIAPWIARHYSCSLQTSQGWFALFASTQDLDAAAEYGGSPCAENALLLEEFQDWNLVSQAKGFIGFAPDVYFFWEIEFENFPFVYFSHGDWSIPGHYLKKGEANPIRVDRKTFPKMLVMKTDFRKQDCLQLADHYRTDQCDSWSGADLRTGKVDEDA